MFSGTAEVALFEVSLIECECGWGGGGDRLISAAELKPDVRPSANPSELFNTESILEQYKM